MKAVYNRCCSDNIASADILDFANWCEKRRLESPLFCFCDLVMSMELRLHYSFIPLERQTLDTHMYDEGSGTL